MDKDVKIAKIKAQQAEFDAAMKVVKELLSNPVVELVGGMAAIEYMLNNPKGNPILKIGGAKQDALEAAIGTAVIAQQVAPLVPLLGSAATGVISAVKSLAPVAAAAAI